MPCSDGGAYDYIDDHRTKQLESKVKGLTKTVEELSNTPSQKELQEAKDKAIEFASRLNDTTALLCKATWELSQLQELHNFTDLQNWFNRHQDEDVARMRKDLDKVVKHKSYTIKSLIKWYGSLSENEIALFHSRREFNGYKLNN
jgi:hypothetical protein